LGKVATATSVDTRSSNRLASGRCGARREAKLRVFLRGKWRDARLQPRSGDAEPYLRRMNKVHAALVRTESSTPTGIEITPA
jgi:hypothetical protein